MSTSAPPKQFAASYLVKKEQPQEIRQRDTPKLNDDEVLIAITATSVNPVDYKMRDWGIFVESYPIILGSDAAGTIAAVGSNVTDFRIGERVFFQGIIGKENHATFQQYATMPADLVGRTPDSVKDEEAANVSLASMAVVVGYYNETGFDIKPRPWEQGGSSAGKGKAIVVLGGSSSVGQFAVQLARLSGFETIVTGSSDAHHDHLRSLGATTVLDRSTAKPEDYAKAAVAQGHTFAMVYDAIAMTATHLEGVAILQYANRQGSSAAKTLGLPTSTLVTVYTPEPEVERAAKARSDGGGGGGEEVALKTVWGIGSSEGLRPAAAAFLRAAGGTQGWLAKEQLVPNRVRIVEGGLKALDKAMDINRAGVSGEKIIIRPFDE